MPDIASNISLFCIYSGLFSMYAGLAGASGATGRFVSLLLTFVSFAMHIGLFLMHAGASDTSVLVSLF